VGKRKVQNKAKHGCSLCGNELVREYHISHERIIANGGELGFRKAFLIDHLDNNGRRNCIETDEGTSNDDVA
jgi:hypothetical protein